MKTIEIRNTNRKILYTHACKNNTLKITLEKAVSEKVDLSYAILIDANLGGAYLQNTNLTDTIF